MSLSYILSFSGLSKFGEAKLIRFFLSLAVLQLLNFSNVEHFLIGEIELIYSSYLLFLGFILFLII